jgi:hypothetical protein
MKYILISILALTIAGCSWEQVEANAEKAASIASDGEKVAVSTSFLTGPYGTAAVPILGAISAIATAVAGLARSKTKKVALAASQAADKVAKGNGAGQALVDAATVYGVVKEIKSAYING